MPFRYLAACDSLFAENDQRSKTMISDDDDGGRRSSQSELSSHDADMHAVVRPVVVGPVCCRCRSSLSRRPQKVRKLDYHFLELFNVR